MAERKGRANFTTPRMTRFASFVCLLAIAFLACLVASVHGDFAPASFAAPVLR